MNLKIKMPIVEIITIGREILDGRVIDTNASYLGERLNRLGLCPRWAQRVDDNEERMMEAFKIAQDRSNFVFCTGGLGPTSDDMTNETFAQFCNSDFVLNNEALLMVEKSFERMKRPMTDVQKKQAYMAKIAVPLANSCGTAPGVSASIDSCQWFFMPGVPREMKAIFEDIEKSLPLLGKSKIWTWKTQFTSEGELGERIQKQAGPTPPGIELCYRTRMPENHISIVSQIDTPQDEDRFDTYQIKLSSILNADSYYSGPLDFTPELEEEIVKLASHKHLKLGFVESCTGGLNSHRITSIPGASEVFLGSFITYSNLLKIDLGVDSEIIEKHGAVSKECALAMAFAGAKKLKNAGASNFLIASTTGIKGPTGGSAEKPIGLCWLALVNDKMEVLNVEEFRARNGLLREDYKKYFSQKALSMLWKYLKN